MGYYLIKGILLILIIYFACGAIYNLDIIFKNKQEKLNNTSMIIDKITKFISSLDPDDDISIIDFPLPNKYKYIANSGFAGFDEDKTHMVHIITNVTNDNKSIKAPIYICFYKISEVKDGITFYSMEADLYLYAREKFLSGMNITSMYCKDKNIDFEEYNGALKTLLKDANTVKDLYNTVEEINETVSNKMRLRLEIQRSVLQGKLMNY